MHPTHLTMPRRGLLAGAAAIGATGLAPNASLAKMTMPLGQAPYFYRFSLGDARATVVSDGPLPLGDPAGSFLGLTKQEMGRQLTDNFLPTNNVVLEQNVLVITINGKTALFDTGMGAVKALAPPPGSLCGRSRRPASTPRGSTPSC